MKTLYAALGVLSLALAIVGVFVPGIPTTEFVLAASYLFARSSPRLQRWLESNRWLGPSLRRFRETRGMPRQAKLLSLASMWTAISWPTSLCATRRRSGRWRPARRRRWRQHPIKLKL